MALTKDKIIASVREKIGFSKRQSRDVIEQLVEIMKKTLASEEDILISGFGKFVVKRKRARRGRNPYTHQDLQLEARRVVTFRHSGVLRKGVNAGPE